MEENSVTTEQCVSMNRPEKRRTYSRKNPASTVTDQEEKDVSETSPSSLQCEEEIKHYQDLICAFKKYKLYYDEVIDLYLTRISSLPKNQQVLLQSYKQSFYELEKCVSHNQELINLIIKDADCLFLNTHLHIDLNLNYKPSKHEIEKVSVTLKHIVRDWGDDGAAERSACYQPIIQEIVRLFPPGKGELKDVKVLVPGSGLGRLPYEIAIRGYNCEGNDYSLFMLIASNFLVNKSQGINTYRIYPWIYQVDNNMTPEDQMHPVRFPDVSPTTELRKREGTTHFSVAAGNFLEIYNDPCWDCVSTCFFIDCAHNVVDFIEKIYEILKPGGVWINFGPLLYHFSSVLRQFSIEPSYISVREAITGVGFVMEKEETNVRASYCQNPRSMFQSEYRCVFFVCRKPIL